MSRTWKRCARKMLGGRRPRGRKKAIRENCRSIPAKNWSDERFPDAHNLIPFIVIEGLEGKGWDTDMIRRHIRKKFSLSAKAADCFLGWCYEGFHK